MGAARRVHLWTRWKDHAERASRDRRSQTAASAHQATYAGGRQQQRDIDVRAGELLARSARLLSAGRGPEAQTTAADSARRARLQRDDGIVRRLATDFR